MKPGKNPLRPDTLVDPRGNVAGNLDAIVEIVYVGQAPFMSNGATTADSMDFVSLSFFPLF